MPLKKSSMPAALVRRASIALAAALSASALWVPAHAAGEATLDDTANCIAVMQTNADDLARRIKAGDKARQPTLEAELRRAGVLIGRTYLDGLHDASEAKARLKAAHERQAAWDAERRNRVHQACVKRADGELAAASGAQRFIVDHYAKAQLERMLKQP